MPAEPEQYPTVAETAQAILVAHQRRDIGSCLCGWADLGRSHPGHQVQMLAAAGVLTERSDLRTRGPGSGP